MLKLTLFVLSIFTLSATAQPRVDNVSPETLKLLDQPGDFSLATVLGLGDAEKALLTSKAGDAQFARLKHMRLNELYTQSTGKYQVIADFIKSDVEEVIATTGEKMAYSVEEAVRLSGNKDGTVPRHFDHHWRNSQYAAFPLIALVNRIDKRDFYAGTCGEVRFIYRVAYYRSETRPGVREAVESRSTMPLFLNVVYEYGVDANGGCSEIAKAWNAEGVVKPAGAETLAAALKSGPLAKDKLRFKQIELNMQAIRYPSEISNFGGQAIYIMRIFQETAGVLAPIPLENTINVAAVNNSSTLLAALKAQLTNPDNLKKIDEGTFILENSEGKLLSTRALSFTTVGRARLANKPFSAVFGANGEALAKDLNLNDLKFVKSARGLVERLNNTTCMGCHQTGGTAGFHLLGRAGVLSTPFNQVILPFSSHYLSERTRRAGYLQALVDGREPSKFRPPSFYPVQAGTDAQGLPTYTAGKTREFCLSAKQTDYATGLACANGSACRLTAKNEAGGIDIGECVQTPNETAGNVCRRGVITSAATRADLGDIYNLFAIKDTINVNETFQDAGGCTPTKEGVPLGRISRKCDRTTDGGKFTFVDAMNAAADKPKEMCVIQGGDVFDNCSTSGNPAQCLEDASATIARAYLDTCSESHPCREDYICQQMPAAVSNQYSGNTRATVKGRIERLGTLKVGFCVPNYFVFNMRVDGHILPEGREAQR